MNTAEKNRYSRHLRLAEIGESGQKKLKAAKVLVVGAGGLGCPLLQYLAAAGVGHIGIIDFDTIEESNLQRQILYTVADLGQNKALTAKKRLLQLNPLIQIEAYQSELTAKNALNIFANYDLVIDGSDNFATRYLVNDAAVILGLPLVYGSIFKFEGQVSVFNYKGGATYRCLFPQPPKSEEVPNCSTVGVLGVLPGIIGSIQANEALKIILEIGSVLSNNLWIYNTLTNQNMTLQFSPNRQIIAETKAMKNSFEQTNYAAFCGLPNADQIKEISAAEFLANPATYTIIDVRESFEEPHFDQLTTIAIPLPRLLREADQIPKNKAVIIVCQKGIRSKIAVDMLQKKLNYTNLFNLTGGIVALQKTDTEALLF